MLKHIKKWGDVSDWEGDWWSGEASWRRKLEVQEVGMGRGGDRAFQVGEQGAEGGEGCGGWVQGVWAGEQSGLLKVCRSWRGFGDDSEILASAPGRMVMVFTKHTLNYVLPGSIEHIAKPCRVLNNWFQSFFPSPCRVKSQ